jgi:hypothetical protein
VRKFVDIPNLNVCHYQDRKMFSNQTFCKSAGKYVGAARIVQNSHVTIFGSSLLVLPKIY